MDNKTNHEISGSVSLSSDGTLLLLAALGNHHVALDIEPTGDGFYRVNSIKFTADSDTEDIKDVKPESDNLFGKGDAAKFIEFVSSVGLNLDEDFHEPIEVAYQMGWHDPAQVKAWRDNAVAEHNTPPTLPVPCVNAT